MCFQISSSPVVTDLWSIFYPFGHLVVARYAKRIAVKEIAKTRVILKTCE